MLLLKLKLNMIWSISNFQRIQGYKIFRFVMSLHFVYWVYWNIEFNMWIMVYGEWKLNGKEPRTTTIPLRRLVVSVALQTNSIISGAEGLGLSCPRRWLLTSRLEPCIQSGFRMRCVRRLCDCVSFTTSTPKGIKYGQAEARARVRHFLHTIKNGPANGIHIFFLYHFEENTRFFSSVTHIKTKLK